VVVLTAHLGNWDLMGLWAASRYPLTIISKVIKNEAVNRFWMEKRAAAGVNIVPAHHSYRACLSALKKGGLLGFILDQNMIHTEGIFVDFFGRPACTTPGLAVLSAHAQAPIVPVFMIRQADGNHVVRMWPALPPPADRGSESIAATTQACTRLVEEIIRQHPEQWIWMHRRWRTQPPAQKG
jgi:KDO2-lipid IV(A) lauroyltransferase